MRNIYPQILILFETEKHTKTPTRIYRVLFHSLIQRKIYVEIISYKECYVI